MPSAAKEPVCGIVARLGLESTGDRVKPDWASALRAMESDFYNTATAGIWYTLTYMVAGCVTDPLEDAIYIPNRLATIAPNTNNNLKRPARIIPEPAVPIGAERNNSGNPRGRLSKMLPLGTHHRTGHHTWDA